MHSHDNGSGWGYLLAAGISTGVSLVPVLTMWLQFVTALIGCGFALISAYKYYNNKK